MQPLSFRSHIAKAWSCWFGSLLLGTDKHLHRLIDSAISSMFPAYASACMFSSWCLAEHWTWSIAQGGDIRSDKLSVYQNAPWRGDADKRCQLSRKGDNLQLARCECWNDVAPKVWCDNTFDITFQVKCDMWICDAKNTNKNSIKSS